METEQKFHSEKDNIHYVEMENPCSGTPQQISKHNKTSSENKPMPIAAKTNETPECLSHGWIMEEKTHSSGLLIGKNCKVVIEKVTPDGLPPGWIKETRIVKKANGTRRDPYYTDPVSGYVFRSQLDVLRYLETGDINSCATKPKKRAELGFLNKEISLPCANMQQLEPHTTRTCLFEGLDNSVTSNLEPTDAEGLQKRQCTSISANEMIASTPTATLLVDKHSLDKGIEECAVIKEIHDPGSLPLPRTRGSKRKLGESVCTKNGIPSYRLTEMVLEKKLEEKQIDSSKSKISLPRRSSKRLAGIMPETGVNLMVDERVRRASARKLGENKADPSLEGLDNVVHSGPQPIESVSKREIEYHDFTVTESPPNLDHPNRSKKPLGDQALPEDQLAEQETEKKPEHPQSQFLYSFGDPWSDPCLEFAFKTLTGAIPIEEDLAIQGMENSLSSSLEATDAKGLQKRQCTSVSADAVVTLTPTAEIKEGKHPPDNGIEECAEIDETNDPSTLPLPRTEGPNIKQVECVCDEAGTVSTPSTELLQGEKLEDNLMVKISSRKVQIDSGKSKKKKGSSMPSRSSKRLAGLKPEMAVNFALSEQEIRAAARKSGQNEGKSSLGPLDNMSHIVPQPFETVSETDIARHAFTGTEVPSNLEINKKPLEDYSVLEDQQVRQGTEKKDENPESQLLYPFEDSWSDPCLEFAFKTLTGEIPIEDNFAIQGYFQQQVGGSHAQREGCSVLPEFGFTNIFQSDISSDLDASRKYESEPQFPENSTFSAPGNLNLPTCSGNAPQQPSFEGNKDHQTKVNS